MGHGDELPVRVVKPEGGTCQRNGLAGFGIHLYDLDIAFKIAVIGKIAIGLSVLRDIHLKVRQQLPAFPAFDLMHHINAVRKVLGLGKPVFITDEMIALRISGVVVAAHRFQIYRKFSAGLRRFQLGAAVVRVLDDGNIAFGDLLGHIQCGAVIFHGVALRLGTHGVHRAVQQIALARRDFTDRPIVSAGIIDGRELAVFIRHIGVHKLAALVYAVDCTGQLGVALRCSGGAVAFRDGGIPLF